MMGLHPLSGPVVEARQALQLISCKWCAGCARIKHRSDFNACASKRDGLQVSCISCSAAKQSAYQSNNRAKLTAKHRDWVDTNRGRLAEYMAAYRRKPERVEAHRLRAAAYRSTVRGSLRNRITSRMHVALKGGKGGKRAEDLLGYTMTELRAHLERQFLKGMSWENMGEWHIDHIVPLSSFTISGPDDPELRRAWALPNLRPLWAKDNIRKGAKIEVLL